MPDWMDEETRMSKNMKPASLSNLTRLLLLTKVPLENTLDISCKDQKLISLISISQYGGVWVDSDVVFVRDLSE